MVAIVIDKLNVACGGNRVIDSAGGCMLDRDGWSVMLTSGPQVVVAGSASLGGKDA
jgi:hypothetical protein